MVTEVRSNQQETWIWFGEGDGLAMCGSMPLGVACSTCLLLLKDRDSCSIKTGNDSRC